MSFRLKAATLAAFGMSIMAALMAADASQASGVEPIAMASVPAVTAGTTNGAMAPGNSAVTFAEPKEFVQPLPRKNEFAESPAASLSQLVDSFSADGDLDSEMRCLAGAVYFESKGEIGRAHV